MTSRPRLATEVNYRNGVGAILLFAVLAWTFVQAQLSVPSGFGDGEITRSIGFALFDMLALVPEGHGETESFLVAFIIIAVVLDAALDGAVMLARREDDGSVVTAIADGGFRPGNSGDATDTTEAASPEETTGDSPVDDTTGDASTGGGD